MSNFRKDKFSGLKKMTLFFDLLNYYELYQSMETLPPREIAEITGIDTANTDFCSKKAKAISILRTLFKRNPNENTAFFKKTLRISSENLNTYLFILEITDPGLVKKKHIASTAKDIAIDGIKTRIAVNKASADNLLVHEIAELLDLSIKSVRAHQQNLPAENEETPEFELLRRESHVREFFNIYPYSTISEAAKSLRMSVKETRVIVEDLIKHGEIIKFNNVPKPLEYEERKLDVIKLKKADPTLTEKDISLELGISISQVRQAIQDTIRIWQIEKIVSYDFYALSMMQELNDVKNMAMSRHKASEQSSSRWLEIVLDAAQKQIDMLGLKAPERVDINKKVTISKEQRDSVVDAYMATEILDVEFKKIQVTGSKYD